MYVIQAKVPVDGKLRGLAQYYCGPDSGFKGNLRLALRFRTEEDARRRSEQSVHCQRMAESGALLYVRGVE